MVRGFLMYLQTDEDRPERERRKANRTTSGNNKHYHAP